MTDSAIHPPPPHPRASRNSRAADGVGAGGAGYPRQAGSARSLPTQLFDDPPRGLFEGDEARIGSHGCCFESESEPLELPSIHRIVGRMFAKGLREADRTVRNIRKGFNRGRASHGGVR